ncbi:MAG: DUF167 domain-containing protein [Nitrospinota bacterium]
MDFELIKETSATLLKVVIVPSSSCCNVDSIIDKRVKIKLKSPPVDNRANRELISFLAKLLKLKKGDISIKNGLSSKRKSILIENCDYEQVKGTIEQLLANK